MDKRFVFVREDRPGDDWTTRFVAGREEARRWYLGARAGAVPAGPGFDWRTVADRGPNATSCREALAGHMPELLDGYDRACALAGGDELDRRIISHYRPAPDASGCTVAVWLGEGGPAMLRNYDFPLGTVSGRFELTDWSGRRRVIGTAQRPWGGLYDGMNDAGLVAAMTFGGAAGQGEGFAVILIVRYLLETCTRVAEAVETACRIPIAQSHNLMLLDRTGEHATVFLGADRAPAVTRDRVTTNHQERVVWPELAARSLTVERKQAVEAAIADPGMTVDGLVFRFLEPPVYSRAARSPTAYSAVYRPAEGRVDYIWPGTAVRQGFDRFEPGEYVHDYGELK